MRTDDLIAQLSDRLEPVPQTQVLRVLALALGGGAILSALTMTVTIGIRPDLGAAMTGGAFWLKFVYTLVIAAFIPEKPILGPFFGTRAAGGNELAHPAQCWFAMTLE